MFHRYLFAAGLVVSLTLISSTAFAEYRFSDGSKIEIQWYEQEGKIINADVCFNYKDSRRKYRQCRRKARYYFKEECEFYTDKIKNTQRKYRDMYTPEQKKFCTAYDTYEP